MTTFQITLSPMRPGSPEAEKEDAILVLAPFQKAPILTFKDVPVGKFADRNLKIVNQSPQREHVTFNKLPAPKCQFTFSDVSLDLEALESRNVSIRWAPNKVASGRETFYVNYNQNSRLNLPVHLVYSAISHVKNRVMKRAARQLPPPPTSRPSFAIPKKLPTFGNFSPPSPPDRRQTFLLEPAPRRGNEENVPPSGKPRRSNRSSPTPGKPRQSRTFEPKPPPPELSFLSQLASDEFDLSPADGRRTTFLVADLNVENRSSADAFPAATGENRSPARERFRPLDAKRLPDCDVFPSPARRTTYSVRGVRAANASPLREICANAMPHRTPSPSAFLDLLDEMTPFVKKSVVKSSRRRSVLSVDERVTITPAGRSLRKVTRLEVVSSSSESEKFSNDSLEEAASPRALGSDVLREEADESVDVVPGMPRFEGAEPADERRWSNETYVKSPCAGAARWEDVDEPAPTPALERKRRRGDGAADVIGSGSWFVAGADATTRVLRERVVDIRPQETRKIRTPRKNRVGPLGSSTPAPGVHRFPAKPTSAASFLMKPPSVSSVPKARPGGSGDVASKKLISIRRARSAMRSLSLTAPTRTDKAAAAEAAGAGGDHDPTDFLAVLANPDPFTSTVDPFVLSGVYHSEQWLARQETDFVKWLNELLTPADELDSNAEPAHVDVASLWQKSCRQPWSVPAPSVEKVSSRVLTHGRLDAVRKAAAKLFRSPAVAAVLAKVVGHVDKGHIAVRADRQVHVDVGLKSTVLGLLLSYNPLWLRVGLETVFGQRLALASNSDWDGLAAFVAARLLDDPYTARTLTHPAVPHLRLPGYREAVGKLLVKKFLALVYFLDQAKGQRLIGHDPCLFCKNAPYKESRELVLAFSRELLAGMGDVTKHLRNLGYVVTQKQTYINEFDYAVAHLGADLRDGIRLTRVMEIILQRPLRDKLRAPPVSRLQKLHNINVALDSLTRAGYALEGDISAKDIHNGHREKTLSLLWQIVYKFQAPRFARAATTVQHWWRRRRLAASIARRIEARRERSVVALQAACRGFLARRRTAKLRQEADRRARAKIDAAGTIQRAWRRRAAEKAARYSRLSAELRRRHDAAAVVQQRWRERRSQRQVRERVTLRQAAAVKIQTWYRRNGDRMRFVRMKASAVCIQSRFRGFRALKRYECAKRSIVLIQAVLRGFQARRSFQLLKKSAVAIQSHYRGYLVRKELVLKNEMASKIQSAYLGFVVRRQYKLQRNAAIKIQSHYRGYLARKELAMKNEMASKIQSVFRGFVVRRENRAQRNAAIKLQSLYRGYLARKELVLKNEMALKIQSVVRGFVVRREYISQRNAALKIQSHYRGYLARKELAFKNEMASKIQSAYRACVVRREFKSQRNAAIQIQTHFRGYLARKEMTLKNEMALKIQSVFRGFVVRRKYNLQRNAAIKIQSHYRGYLARKEMTLKNEMASKIQSAYRACVVRREYKSQRKAAIKIQRLYRRYLARKQLALKNEMASKIQSMFRGFVVRRKYKLQRNAAIKIQSYFRGYLARKMMTIKNEMASKIQSVFRGFVVRRQYWSQRNAAIKIQSHYRGYLARKELVLKNEMASKIQSVFRGFVVRRKYNLQRNAAIKIQSQFQGYLARKELTLKNEMASKIQSAYRACVVRREYKSQRNAAIKIQSHFRGYLARKEMTTKNEMASKIQSAFRGFVVRREFKSQRNAAIKIQSQFRGYLARKELALKNEMASKIQSAYRACVVRREYKLQRNAAIKIQWLYRRYLARKQLALKNEMASKIQSAYRGFVVRREYRSQKNAAIKIQSHYRGYLARKEMIVNTEMACREEARQRDLLRQTSAVTLQSLFRGFIARKRLRQAHLAAVKIQSLFRGFVARQTLKRKQVAAAVSIQAWWRGVQVRKKRTARLAVISERVAAVSADVDEDRTLMGRYLWARTHLFSSNWDMGHMIMLLTTLDTVTQLSPLICRRLCEDRAVPAFYRIVADANRSIPHQEAIALVLQILNNLARYEQTSPVVWQDPRCIDTMVHLMSMYGNKPGPIACNAATLLWLFAHDQHKAQTISGRPGVPEQLQKLLSAEKRRRELAAKSGRAKAGAPGKVSPTTRPDWGLGRAGKHRAFQDFHVAVAALARALNVTPA